MRALQLEVCSSLYVCPSAFFSFLLFIFYIQACLRLFLLMFLSSRVLAVFINLKSGSFTTAFPKQIYHRDVGHSVSFHGY